MPRASRALPCSGPFPVNHKKGKALFFANDGDPFGLRLASVSLFAGGLWLPLRSSPRPNEKPVRKARPAKRPKRCQAQTQRRHPVGQSTGAHRSGPARWRGPARSAAVASPAVPGALPPLPGADPRQTRLESLNFAPFGGLMRSAARGNH